jgi:toxin YoeB
LEFDIAALEDLAWWIQQDRNKALRIVTLIKEIHRDPFRGIGKPEPLKHELKGCWSRRIDQKTPTRLRGHAGKPQNPSMPVSLLD